jgi:hypothetical protein
MGYHTDFKGHFTFDHPLTDAQREYLTKFNQTRRMKRNSFKVETFPDPVRNAVGLPVGLDGGYFVGAAGSYGQDHDSSVTDYNREPAGQPGLWCQWAPNASGTKLEWDGGEKFYNYIEWLEYIITHFLAPWGRTITGVVKWDGEEQGDDGKIIVKDNKIEIA